MPGAPANDVTKKRKRASVAADADYGKKKKKKQQQSDATAAAGQPQNNKPTLIAPHEAIISELAPKYDVLPLSIISSTAIRKRVAHVTGHLLDDSSSDKDEPSEKSNNIKKKEKQRVAVLYARTADACKLITVVEQCKRLLAEQGRAWYQYNQLFDQPEQPKKAVDVVEETVLKKDAGPDGESDDDDDDDFEVMESRFEKAVLPPRPTNVVKSIRVFLAVATVPELKLKGATVQSSDGTKG